MTSIGAVEIHERADVAAPLIYWLAEGHMEARPGGQGILLPWAMLGLGLMSTEDLHGILPPRTVKFANWVTGEGARTWRGYSRDIILAWRDPFWRGLACGVNSGILKLDGVRIKTAGRLPPPKNDVLPVRMRKLSRALGATLGAEEDDGRIAAALGVDFVE